MVQATSLGQTKATASGNVLLYLDVFMSGEPVTAPHVRSPPFRKEQARKLLGALIAARRFPGQEGKLAHGDVLVFADAGKRGEQFKCSRFAKKSVIRAMNGFPCVFILNVLHATSVKLKNY